MKKTSIVVNATWDEDAKVWFAQSADILGLATEADTLESLRQKVLVMIPELIELNGLETDLSNIPVRIVAEQSALVAIPASH